MSLSEQMTLTTPNLSITNFDLPSLHLLHNEIMVILKDTETHLSEFNDDLEQAPLLLDSIDVLRQLSCIFKLVSLAGGQVLSTAIANSLQQLYDSGGNTNNPLIMDLSEAIMTLDRYIEFVLLTETVEPALLLPIINKLNSYGSQEVLDADYFSSFGSSSVTIANPEQNFQPLIELNLDGALLTNAFRSGLTIALTYQEGIISQDAKLKLSAMSAACTLIAAHTSTLFWQAATAAVTDIEAILPLSLSQKQTLIYLEQQFHCYLPVMDTRFADLVSFACQRDNEHTDNIRKQYAINQLDVPQREQMKRFLLGPNRKVIDTLNDLIQAEINTIKEQVDSYARDDSLNVVVLEASQIANKLMTLSSTLRLLGLKTAATAIQNAGAAVAKWQTPIPSDFDHLLLALMSAENASIAMAKLHTPGVVKLPLNNSNISLHQLDTAYDTLIQESRISIASAEQAMNDYLADANRDLLNIQNTPEMIRQVAGAVSFLQLPISASMLSQLASYIEHCLEKERPIAEETLAYMADVMMSVDYRLEGFEHNHPVSKQSFDIGQHSLRRLLAA